MVTPTYKIVITSLRLVPWLSLMFAFLPLLLLTITSVFHVLTISPSPSLALHPNLPTKSSALRLLLCICYYCQIVSKQQFTCGDKPLNFTEWGINPQHLRGDNLQCNIISVRDWG